MTLSDTPSEPETFYCSFCGKSPQEVAKFVAGPAVFICNECIDLMHDMIHPPGPPLGEENGDER